MLRNAVLALGVFLLGCAFVVYIRGDSPAALACLIWGGLITASVVFERVRYKPLERKAPQGNWVRTAERFVDDETGAVVTVYLDPDTGERKYVRE